MEPSLSENYTFSYDKTLPLKDQILHTDGKKHLLNVRLHYTNNLFFGVNWCVLSNNKLYHLFKCKDRELGFSEKCGESLDIFLSSFRNSKRVLNITNYTQSEDNFTIVKQDTHITNILNREIDVYFAYEEDKYRHTMFQFKDDKNILKGLYAPKKELFATEGPDPFRVGYVCDEDKNPTIKDLNYFLERSIVSLSNVNTFVNTEYSKIKIY